MASVWSYGAFGAMLALCWMLVKIGRERGRRRLREQLGLPTDSPITAKESAALTAFKNTDATLRNTFPRMSDTQRQALAREVLRDIGVLPSGARGNAAAEAPTVAKED